MNEKSLSEEILKVRRGKSHQKYNIFNNSNKIKTISMAELKSKDLSRWKFSERSEEMILNP